MLGFGLMNFGVTSNLEINIDEIIYMQVDLDFFKLWDVTKKSVHD